MYYIYVYIDPRNNLPFYVGKGSGDRKFHHLNETLETTDNREKFYKIQKLKSIGLLPIIETLVDNIEDETIAYQLEDEWILKYGRKRYEKGGGLTNICLGNRPPICKGSANGMHGKTRTEEEKKKVSAANKGKTPWNKGIPRTQEVKDAISLTNKGNTAWNKGIERSSEDRQKMKDGKDDRAMFKALIKKQTLLNNAYEKYHNLVQQVSPSDIIPVPLSPTASASSSRSSASSGVGPFDSSPDFSAFEERLRNLRQGVPRRSRSRSSGSTRRRSRSRGGRKTRRQRK